MAISQRGKFETERKVTAPFSGSNQALGTPLDARPAMVLLDNASDVEVAFLVDGVTWKTFPAGEAMVLDMNANTGNAPSFSVGQGTQFAVNGTAGTGFFSCAIISAVGG